MRFKLVRLAGIICCLTLLVAAKTSQAQQPAAPGSPCTMDNDCPGEQVCQDGSCKEPAAAPGSPCTVDNDCPGELICRDSVCSAADPPAATPVAAPVAPAAAPVAPAATPVSFPAPVPAAAAPPPDDLYVGYIEWVSLRAGGGSYGGHVGVSAFTLRWRWFFWNILRITGGGGTDGGNPKFDVGYYGTAGTMVGLPVHLGANGRHEIRGGVGIAGGIIQQEVYRTWWQEEKMWYCTSHGPFLQFELLYQFHILRRVAVLVGYNNSIILSNEHNDNGYPDDNWEASDVHGGFLGVAF